jgi:DNA-directed RNA polymerase specialized sigma24 family protein
MSSRDSEDGARERTAARFATTHWSTVLAAGDSASPHSREALEKFCRTYWYPLYALVRRKGYSPEDAQDLTQAFFERFIEKHYLKNVVVERGRFRRFLLTSLNHFLANEWDRSQALKRGGGLGIFTADPAVLEKRYASEVGSQGPPERHFDRLWAEAVMDHALTLLEDEFKAPGKADQFDALADFASRSPDEGEYAKVGERLGLNSHAVAMAVARLRDRYRALVRAEIADTVDGATDLEAELRYLVELVSG